MRKYSTPTFEINSFLIWSDHPCLKFGQLLQSWQPEAYLAGGAGSGVKDAFTRGSAIAFRCPIGSRNRLRFASNIALAMGGGCGIMTCSSLGLQPVSPILHRAGSQQTAQGTVYYDSVVLNDEKQSIVDAIRGFTNDPTLILEDEDQIEPMPLYVLQSDSYDVLHDFQQAETRWEHIEKSHQVEIVPLEIHDSIHVRPDRFGGLQWDHDSWSQLYSVYPHAASLEMYVSLRATQDELEQSHYQPIGAYIFYPHWCFHYREPEADIDEFQAVFGSTVPLIGCECQLQIGYDYNDMTRFESRSHSTDIAIFWSKSA